ncbi:LysR family transcriptional regulator [Salinicola corii]|uniref:LysR family transcriptional regulator n=1 Tax=Salinicola corii TaxID=2606937 RepID=A0A640WDY1_9GAMM|nr:LysR family transcriptional regulator [Salinicola corii]KAA0018190.1 LysR family transcriptional regulator [Salinicola corii]
MELVWLEDFIALAEHGSFVRAAEARHITQPAFSRRIRALEAWMDVTLFTRMPQGTSLTEAGRAMHRGALESATRLHRLREEVREVAGKTARTLQFAATHSLSFTFFPRWIRQIEKGAPLEALQLHTESMAECEQRLMQGRVHFLLSHRHPEVPTRLDPGRFESRRIAQDTLVPLIGAELGRKLGEGKDAAAGFDPEFLPADDPAVPYLAYTDASGLGRIVSHRLRSDAEFASRAPLFSSHLAAVLMSMALENKGMAWLPLILAESEWRGRQLVRALGPAWDIPVEIHIARARAALPAAAEEFWQRLATLP